MERYAMEMISSEQTAKVLREKGENCGWRVMDFDKDLFIELDYIVFIVIIVILSNKSY